LTQIDIDNLNFYFINLSNLKTIIYKKQWPFDGGRSFIINNDKLNNLEESRNMFIIKENFILFQNYKDFNFFLIK
jgi:hypothetical protein